MNEIDKMCDICRRSAYRWPQTFTVIGPRNLCGRCYVWYRQLLEEIAAFFNRDHTGEPPRH
jgi:bacterioferritin-associated ferredoxin